MTPITSYSFLEQENKKLHNAQRKCTNEYKHFDRYTKVWFHYTGLNYQKQFK